MAISDRLPRLSQKKALVGTLALVSGAALEGSVAPVSFRAAAMASEPAW